MSDTKNVVFRSAVGGYNKNDVNEYLVRQSAELTEREEAAKERVRNAEKEVAEYEKKLSSFEEELANIKSQLEEKDSEIERLNAEKTALEESAAFHNYSAVDEYQKKSDQQEAVITKQFEKIDLLRGEIEELRAKLSDSDSDKERYEELSKKAALYEKTSANIGEAIISANKTAEEIISAAKEEARLLTDRAQKELDEKRKSLEESSRRAMESIFGKLTLAASEGRKDISSASSYTYQVLEKALEDIKSRNNSSEAKLKNHEESLWRSIKDDLDSVGFSVDKKPQKKMTPEQMRRIKRQ